MGKTSFLNKVRNAAKDSSLDYLKDNVYTSADTKILQVKLSTERFTISMIEGLTSRVYNHWKNSGLLPLIRNSKIERLSYLEFFWIRIIMQLREFGMPLEKIRKVKRKIFDYDIRVNKFYSDSFYIDKYNELGHINYQNLFTYVLLITIVKKIDVRLIIDSDGDSYFEVNPTKKATFSHISVPLIEIINDFLRNTKNISDIMQSGMLSEQELKVIGLLKSGNLKSITINYTKGKPKKIEITKITYATIEHRLMELMQNGKCQSITIHKDEKNIQYCEITTKEQF